MTGNARGKIVTINVDNTSGMLTTGVYSVIATLKEGYRPAQTYNQMLGAGEGGAWLMLAVTPDGRVAVYHIYGPGGSVNWGTVHASVTFVAA